MQLLISRHKKTPAAAHAPVSSGRDQAGFTMVEIALSIAVVAFALVAILGVLPTGMNVQKDNRDDNIINQEGRYWIEAIRTGARGLEDLTNYVESITISNLTTKKFTTFDLAATSGAANQVGNPLSPLDVVALLSTPKYIRSESNRVTARVKAISGPASEKGPLTNEFSFRYEMQVEITPGRSIPPGAVANLPQSEQPAAIRFNEAMGENLHDLRIIMRWPVVQRGTGWYVGGNRKSFRARLAGSLQVETNVTSTVADGVSSVLRTNLVIALPNRFNVKL